MYLVLLLLLGKALLALMAHFIDDDFKLREVLIFAKPFSSMTHSAEEIEKAIKIGLASWGIGEYDTSKTPVIDTIKTPHTVFESFQEN